MITFAGCDTFSLNASPIKNPSTELRMAKGFGKKDKVSNQVEVDTSTIAQPKPTAFIEQREGLNGGQEALARLRRVEAEKRNEELRAMQDLRSVDQSLLENPNAAVIPEKVAQRMGMRMLPFVGLPLFGVMGTFVVFWYLATYKNMEFQPALVAFSTIGVLGVGLLVSHSFPAPNFFPSIYLTLLENNNDHY